MTAFGGRLAQLGERRVRNAEVEGSIPLPSTNLFQLSPDHRALTFAASRSSFHGTGFDYNTSRDARTLLEEEERMHGSRLTRPMVKDAGKLRPATWDEALDRAAKGLRAAVDRKGPSTFGLFSCSKATNEVNYLAQKFARAVIGSNNVDSCNRT